MITQATVLTATAITTERLGSHLDLSKNVGPLIEGLNQSVLSMDGYTLQTVATQLPKNTEGDSEHTQLVNESSEAIANVIRASLGVVSKYIIPACDTLEDAIKRCCNKNEIIKMIFQHLQINMTYFNTDLLSSSVLNVEPDAEYQAGVKFVPGDNIKGDWPELSCIEIANLCKEALSYPEIVEIFEDENAVHDAYRALFTKPGWLYGYENEVSVSKIDFNIKDINKLIILNILVHKLDSMEDPLDGVNNVSLDEYRLNIRRIKRFVKTLLFRAKANLENVVTRGLSVSFENVKLDPPREDDNYSFTMSPTLSGTVSVIYTKTIADYFEASDNASISEVVAGLAFANATNKIIPGNTVLEYIPAAMEYWKTYLSDKELALITNIRKEALTAVNEALSDIAKNGDWKIFLEQCEGMSGNFAKLQKRLNAAGGYVEVLTSPTFISDVIEGRKRVAASVIAPRLAVVLGVPVAEKILSANLDVDCSCPEKQRRALSKSIVKTVIESIMR